MFANLWATNDLFAANLPFVVTILGGFSRSGLGDVLIPVIRLETRSPRPNFPEFTRCQPASINQQFPNHRKMVRKTLFAHTVTSEDEFFANVCSGTAMIIGFALRRELGRVGHFELRHHPVKKNIWHAFSYGPLTNFGELNFGVEPVEWFNYIL